MRATRTSRFFFAWLACSILGLIAARATTAACEPSPVPAEQLAQGWIALFDGSTLFG